MITPDPKTIRQLQHRVAYLGNFLRLRDGLRLACRSLWLALLLSLLIELAARLWPIPDRHTWALVPPAVWLLGTALYAILRPQSLQETARQLDRELHLKDRLATALELQAAQDQRDPLDLKERQLADAVTTVDQLSPKSLSWQVTRRPLGWAAGLAVIVLTVIWLPNPMDDILRHRAAVQEAAQAQTEAIREARDQLEAATDPTSEERSKALQELERLLKELAANPGNLEQALADLAQAQARLRELQSPDAAGQRNALEQVAARLTGLSRGESQASSNSAAAGQALTALAASLPGLDAAAQAELAASLEALAGDAAATHPNLAEELLELANAVRAGDVSEALNVAGAAQGVLTEAGQQVELQDALLAAQAALDESRQQLAAAGQAQGGAQAQAQGQGQGQGQQLGQNPGQGQVGGGGGTTANQLPGANRTGQAANPDRPNRPPGLTDLETIYAPGSGANFSGNPDFIPGQETGQGQTIIRQEQSPQGNVSPSLVPYREVYQEYANAAAETMERDRIPAEWQEYVRDYFSQLEPE